MVDNDVLRAIRGRRSVIRFTDQAVTDEELSAIVEAGRWAPSYINSQPCEFLVVRDAKARARLSEILRRVTVAWQGFATAPVSIVVMADPERDVRHLAEDGAAAAQNMALAAHSLGLATFWAGLHRVPGNEGVRGERPEGRARHPRRHAAGGGAARRPPGLRGDHVAPAVVRNRARGDLRPADERARRLIALNARGMGTHSAGSESGRPCGRCHYNVAFVAPVEMPPSTSSVCPVRYALASEARKTIAPSRSFGRPGRFSGIRSTR